MEGLGSIWRSKSLVFMIIVIIIPMNFVEFSSAELHYVGGSKVSWAPNVNFTDWSSHQQFHLGDWLYFGYNKLQFNVLEVNKTSYENCVDRDFISNITKGGGRDVVELTKLKTYYFLSSGGYCFQGLKVAIPVEDVQPVPAPSPPRNHSPMRSQVSHITSAFVLVMLIYAFCYF